jgi:hypothetical protein
LRVHLPPPQNNDPLAVVLSVGSAYGCGNRRATVVRLNRIARGKRPLVHDYRERRKRTVGYLAGGIHSVSITQSNLLVAWFTLPGFFRAKKNRRRHTSGIVGIDHLTLAPEVRSLVSQLKDTSAGTSIGTTLSGLDESRTDADGLIVSYRKIGVGRGFIF